MTKIIAVVTIIVLCGSVFLGGCQSLSRSKEQQIQKYSRISELNRRMLGDDIDAYLMMDRPSRLSRMHIMAD